jgi:HPt (histidine-containing phosphotransfer) domain-containing protein
MNLKKLAENLEMEEEEFWEMMELFLETSISDLSHLRLSQEKGDAIEAVRSAHSIKGAATSLGLTEIFQLAKTIEMEARGNHLDRAEEGIQALQEMLNRMAEEFEGGKQQAIGYRQ